jgi:hypothetical protein
VDQAVVIIASFLGRVWGCLSLLESSASTENDRSGWVVIDTSLSFFALNWPTEAAVPDRNPGTVRLSTDFPQVQQLNEARYQCCVNER